MKTKTYLLLLLLTLPCFVWSQAGGAGGFSPYILHLNMDPVKDVARNEDDLSRFSFDFSDNTMFMAGGMGYGGTKNGVRFGGCGYFGFKRYDSDPLRVQYRDTLNPLLTSDTLVDSIARVNVMIALGGLLAEKGFSAGSINFIVGGMYGGGALILNKNFLDAQNNSAFNYDSDTESDKEEHNDSLELSKWTAAPFMCFDVHAGATFSFTSWMHIGADASALFIYSSSGFAFNTDSFFTYNPGIRFRIVFGNIG